MTFPRTFPVVHNITNYVAMGISANALLAVGASPLMSSAPAEMEDIASFAAAMVANLGCLEPLQVEAMSIAAAAYHRLGKPWVLDPAGVGIGAFRMETALRLIDASRPSVIRGNAAEIAVLAGKRIRPSGLDVRVDDALLPDDAAKECAKELSVQSGAVVVMSGVTDIITDGRDVIRVRGGSPMMAGVTAMGCTASAIIAAFLAERSVPADGAVSGRALAETMSAASDAMAVVKRAGEMAAASSSGPGSFAVNFIDAIAAIRKNSASSQ